MGKTKPNEKGYLVFPNKNKPYKLVHRWKAERKYGIEEIKGKDIHHIDKDKQNNGRANLLLLTKEDHYNLHQYENKRDFAYMLIIILSLAYFGFIFIANFIPYTRQPFLTIAKILIIGILVIAIELKWGFISKAIKRPNQKLRKEDYPKQTSPPQTYQHNVLR